jgi:hypothetical protein
MGTLFPVFAFFKNGGDHEMDGWQPTQSSTKEIVKT